MVSFRTVSSGGTASSHSLCSQWPLTSALSSTLQLALHHYYNHSTPMVWTCRKNGSRPNLSECTTLKIPAEKIQRRTNTALDRQYTREHNIIWTDPKGNNGFDNWPRTMETVYSYPSPSKGWLEILMMMKEAYITRAGHALQGALSGLGTIPALSSNSLKLFYIVPRFGLRSTLTQLPRHALYKWSKWILLNHSKWC